jgi:predicted transcriptional regulator
VYLSKALKMKYRSRTDIFASILQSANNPKGVGITTIMYKSFLSHYQLKKYLSVMLENDLINLEEQDHLYKITEKGVRFLQLFSNINELIDTTKEYNL